MFFKIFSDWKSWGIAICGLILFVILYVIKRYLAKKKEKIEYLLDDKGEFDDASETNMVADIFPEKLIEAEKEFNKVCSWHTAFSQLIPLFPLLGVLGTVWGLMEQVSAENIENMLKSLDTALGTTLVGITCAILLKAYDALGSSRMISDTEVMLDDLDKKIEIKEKRNSSEKK